MNKEIYLTQSATMSLNRSMSVDGSQELSSGVMAELGTKSTRFARNPKSEDGEGRKRSRRGGYRRRDEARAIDDSLDNSATGQTPKDTKEGSYRAVSADKLINEYADRVEAGADRDEILSSIPGSYRADLERLLEERALDKKMREERDGLIREIVGEIDKEIEQKVAEETRQSEEAQNVSEKFSKATLENPIEAVWKNKDFDQPVKIIGSLGMGSDGREYLAIEGSRMGVPKDEVFSGSGGQEPPIKPPLTTD